MTDTKVSLDQKTRPSPQDGYIVLDAGPDQEVRAIRTGEDLILEVWRRHEQVVVPSGRLVADVLAELFTKETS